MIDPQDCVFDLPGVYHEPNRKAVSRRTTPRIAAQEASASPDSLTGRQRHDPRASFILQADFLAFRASGGAECCLPRDVGDRLTRRLPPVTPEK